MENIQTDEETTTPRRRVANAYSTNDRANNLKRNAFWIVCFVAYIILSTGNSGGESKKQKRAKKLRNKAETIPDVEMHKLHAMNKQVELNEKYNLLNDRHDEFEDIESASIINQFEDEGHLDREFEKALTDVAMAEEDEIETNNSMLTTAVQTMEESVKYYLGGVFGYGDDKEDDDDDDDVAEMSADVQLTEEQLDVIAKKISDRLEIDAKKDLRARADSVKLEKVHEIEGVLAEDKDQNMNDRDIANDVHEAEVVVVEDLKDEIDEAATRVKDSLPMKVKRIRNQVVEEVTGKKLDEIEKAKRAKKARKAELMMKFKEIQAKARDAENLKNILKNEIMQLEKAGSDDGMYRTRTNDSMYKLGKVAPPPAPAFGSKAKNSQNTCRTESECKAKSKEMSMEFNSIVSSTKGCFSRNDKVFFSLGTEDEMTTTDLSGMKVRVYCDTTDDDSSSNHSNDDKKIGRYPNRFKRKPEYDKSRYPSKPTKYGKPRYPIEKPSSEDEELRTKRESKKYHRHSPSDNKSEDRDASEEEDDDDSADESAEEDESGSEDGSEIASKEEE